MKRGSVRRYKGGTVFLDIEVNRSFSLDCIGLVNELLLEISTRFKHYQSSHYILLFISYYDYFLGIHIIFCSLDLNMFVLLLKLYFLDCLVMHLYSDVGERLSLKHVFESYLSRQIPVLFWF